MNGFEFDKDDPHSTISVKTLRVHLRPKIPDLQQIMLQKINIYFESEVLQGKAIDST